MAKCMIMRRGGGGAAGGLPNFTYTGTYSLIDDGDKNWRIKFLTSGTFTPKKAMTADVFLVGGGAGSAGKNPGNVSSGAGGGYTRTFFGSVLEAGVPYSVVVGAGGAAGASGAGGGAGGKTWIASESLYFANGASATGYYGSGGNGGSGGGGSGQTAGGNGGTDGGNGTAGSGAYAGGGGTGQGTTTKEFGESSGTEYSEGGKGTAGAGAWKSGVDNTGNGACGTTGTTGYTGGSGIVVIRNHRA